MDRIRSHFFNYCNCGGEHNNQLEADPQPDAIEHLAELIGHHFPGLLENPDAMGGKRNDKPVFKDRQRAFAKRLLKLLESA